MKILDVQKAQQGGGLSSAKAKFLGSEASAQEGVGQALDKIRGQGAGAGFTTAPVVRITWSAAMRRSRRRRPTA